MIFRVEFLRVRKRSCVHELHRGTKKAHGERVVVDWRHLVVACHDAGEVRKDQYLNLRSLNQSINLNILLFWGGIVLNMAQEGRD